MNRKEAKELGLTRFNTGCPCKYGHVCDRVTSSGVCLECHRERENKRYEINPDKKRNQISTRRASYPGLYKAQAKSRRAGNPAIHRESHKKWRKSNPDAYRSIQMAYRARKLGAEGRYTAQDIITLRLSQPNCVCGVSFNLVKATVDHKTPLARGGSNNPENLQLLCGPCNSSKYVKTLAEWELEHMKVG